MTVVSTIATAISIALPILNLSREEIDKINAKCVAQGLPPAFEINSSADTNDLSHDFLVRGNPDYRFEGFGLVLGIPPKIQFWIHYKSGSPEHVSVGRHFIPLKFISSAFNLPEVLK